MKKLIIAVFLLFGFNAFANACIEDYSDDDIFNMSYEKIIALQKKADSVDRESKSTLKFKKLLDKGVFSPELAKEISTTIPSYGSYFLQTETSRELTYEKIAKVFNCQEKKANLAYRLRAFRAQRATMLGDGEVANAHLDAGVAFSRLSAELKKHYLEAISASKKKPSSERAFNFILFYFLIRLLYCAHLLL